MEENSILNQPIETIQLMLEWEKNSELSWKYYLNAEKKFINFLKCVPLDLQHYKVWSPYLGDLLINIGSYFDSFLQGAIYSDYCSKTVRDIKTFRNAERPSMELYRNLFERQHQFSQKTIYDLFNFLPIIPLSNWKENKSPEWWTNYTHLKHNRFKNRKEATLQNTLNALGSFFLLHVNFPDTRYILLREGFIESVQKIDSTSFTQILVFNEPLNTDQIVYTKTQLFGYVYETKSKKLDNGEKIAYLSIP
jgi:hypothetical protein